MDEKCIRGAVHSQLLRHFHQDCSARVIDELGLLHGKARIDIAIINGNLHGIEIKSARDDLSRLCSQVKIYNLVFNKVTLVLAERFLNDATEIVPSWWRIITVTQGPRGGIYLNRARLGKSNLRIDLHSMVMLLWRDEVIDLLKAEGITGTSLHKPRSALYSKLVGAMDHKTLHEKVCTTLKHRGNWRNLGQP